MSRYVHLMPRRAVLGGALAALGGCGLLGVRSWTVRYRLTIATKSPAAEAATIIETKYDGPLPTLGLPVTYLYNTSTRGDAPSFATRGGGRLFAIFTPGAGGLANEGYHYFSPTDEQTLVSVLEDGDDVEAHKSGRLYDELVAMTGARNLAPSQWPRLVWLSDEDDLSTAHFVPLPGYDYALQAGTPQLALADVMGEGAEIVGVTIERTDEPISQQLHQRFSWLNGMNGDDGVREWRARSPFWANLQRQYFALRGE